MRSVKSGLVLVALAAAGVGAAVAGCSADGSGAYIDPTPVPTTTEEPNQPPPPAPPPTDNKDASAPRDAGRDATTSRDSGTDARPVEAGRDAAPATEYPEGTPCTTVNQVNTVPCGICGTKSQVCLPGDGGNAWTATGFCVGEVAGGCLPGTTRQQACGLCGTQTDTCQNNCTWATGLCTGQPANACSPNSKEFVVGLGCTIGPYSGRERVCDNNCTWGAYGACQDPPPNANVLTAPAAVGGVVTGNYTFSASATTPRVTGTCPNATVSSTLTPTVYVEVKNTGTTQATYSIWQSGTPAIDTVIAAYNGPVVPATDAARKACAFGVNDYCPSNLPCATDDDWGGLTNSGTTMQAVVIPAGGSALIYNACYSTTCSGSFTLNVRRDQ